MFLAISARQPDDLFNVRRMWYSEDACCAEGLSKATLAVLRGMQCQAHAMMHPLGQRNSQYSR